MLNNGSDPSEPLPYDVRQVHFWFFIKLYQFFLRYTQDAHH